MKKQICVGINGFGRIGRNLFKLLLDHPNIRVVAINDLADARTLAHLLKYDSIHGMLQRDISVVDSNIVIDGRSFPVIQQPQIEKIDWTRHQTDIVIDCTGKFKTRSKLQHHLQEGVRKVILSVPPLDDSIKMIVQGVNHEILDGSETIISNASCTTNNAAPMIKVMNDLCGVEQAYITTVHSYTSDQSLHDQPHKDLRRARSAAQSIIPTTTGAAKALTTIFPQLSQVIGGCGIRVPVPNASLTDMTLRVNENTTIETVNEAFKKAAETDLKSYLQYTEEPIVSVDVLGNSHSCVFDSLMTSVIGGNFVKIIGWYDNEIGYANRLVDLIPRI